MYKVFFNDRTVFFGDDFSRAFVKHKGLFYKYNNFIELNELVGLFDSLVQIKNLYILHENILMVFEEFKACFTVIEAGGGVVLNERGEFLIILRNGTWDLPKGKLEQGEDFQGAALREVEEETGLPGLTVVEPLVSTYHTYHLKDKLNIWTTHLSKYRNNYFFFNEVTILIFDKDGNPLFRQLYSISGKRT